MFAGIGGVDVALDIEGACNCTSSEAEGCSSASIALLLRRERCFGMLVANNSLQSYAFAH